MAKTKHNRGMFKRGYDPRRHKFTKDECQRGFQAAIISIVTRNPGCVDAYGRHMVCKFLKSKKEKA
jgi:hypothetical protein